MSFLTCLAEEFDVNHDEWENRTISAYLESISAWMYDSDEEPEHLDFRELAKLFYVGKIYE